jgi:chromate transport protein ChrA
MSRLAGSELEQPRGGAGLPARRARGWAWGLTSIVLPGAVIMVSLGALYVRGDLSPSVTLLIRSLSAWAGATFR